MSQAHGQKTITVCAPIKPVICILFTHFLKSIYVLWPLALCMVCIQERVIVARIRYIMMFLKAFLFCYIVLKKYALQKFKNRNAS